MPFMTDTSKFLWYCKRCGKCNLPDLFGEGLCVSDLSPGSHDL